MKFTNESVKDITTALESVKAGSVVSHWCDWRHENATMIKDFNGKWYDPRSAKLDSYGTPTANMVASIHYGITNGDDSYELIPVEQYESFKIMVYNSHRQPIRRETYKGAYDTALRIRMKEHRLVIVEGVRFEDDGIHFDLVAKI